MLNQEAIAEFKTLYLKECGVKLTDEQALNLGTKLIRLVKVIYGPNLPKQWLPKIDTGKTKE